MADVLDRAHRLGHEVFAPIAAKGDPGRLNRPLVRALGEHGLLELVFAGSAVELCELREGLAHGCTEAETALALQGLGGYPILSRGRPAVRDEWIPRLSSVEADQVLGDLDGGFVVAMDTLDLFRPSVGAFAVGMAQAALDAAVGHTQEREAFGKPLAQFQAVSHQLAEVATEIQAARLLVREAATQYDAGVRPVRKASAMAKLFATEAAQRAVDVAIQLHGARALQTGHLLEPLYREVRAPRIYEGASEVQREIIARELFKEAG